MKGKKVFECDPGYGGFVRGKNVTTGDFPERDILDEVSDDEEEQTVSATGAPEGGISGGGRSAEDEDEI